VRRPYRAPKGSFEALASVYGDVLGVDRVGLDDDFFELGGDERSLPQLVAAIHERFGLHVSEATVRGAPTVAALGARIGRRRARKSPIVVPLSPDRAADASPFFCVAGGGGPATQLHALSDSMTNRAFYGIQQRGLEERCRADWRVAPYARRALREVRALQPVGPYLLGGHSYGALVAFEMARQLIDAEADVGLLVIIDVPVAPWATAAQIRRRAKPARRPAHDGVLWAKRAVRQAKLTTVGLMTRPGLDQYDAFYLLSMHIGRRYRVDAPCPAPTLIVRAIDVEYFPDPTKAAPDLGWTPLLTGPVTCVDAPGNHLTMVRRPCAPTLAGLIEAAIPAGR
jgi:thioesterase domain-containing protein